MWDAVIALVHAPFVVFLFVLFVMFVAAVGVLDWLGRR